MTNLYRSLNVLTQCCEVMVKRLTQSGLSCTKSSTMSDLSQHVSSLVTVVHVCLACPRHVDLSELLKLTLSHLFDCHGQSDNVKMLCANITSSLHGHGL